MEIVLPTFIHIYQWAALKMYLLWLSFKTFSSLPPKGSVFISMFRNKYLSFTLIQRFYTPQTKTPFALVWGRGEGDTTWYSYHDTRWVWNFPAGSADYKTCFHCPHQGDSDDIMKFTRWYQLYDTNTNKIDKSICISVILLLISFIFRN